MKPRLQSDSTLSRTLARGQCGVLSTTPALPLNNQAAKGGLHANLSGKPLCAQSRNLSAQSQPPIDPPAKTGEEASEKQESKYLDVESIHNLLPLLERDVHQLDPLPLQRVALSLRRFLLRPLLSLQGPPPDSRPPLWRVPRVELEPPQLVRRRDPRAVVLRVAQKTIGPRISEPVCVLRHPRIADVPPRKCGLLVAVVVAFAESVSQFDSGDDSRINRAHAVRA